MQHGKLGAVGGFSSLGSAGKPSSSTPSTAGQPIGLLLALTKAS